MPSILIDMLTRSMYDMKHAINNKTATFNRVGIFSKIKEKKKFVR